MRGRGPAGRWVGILQRPHYICRCGVQHADRHIPDPRDSPNSKDLLRPGRFVVPTHLWSAITAAEAILVPLRAVRREAKDTSCGWSRKRQGRSQARSGRRRWAGSDLDSSMKGSPPATKWSWTRASVQAGVRLLLSRRGRQAQRHLVTTVVVPKPDAAKQKPPTTVNRGEGPAMTFSKFFIERPMLPPSSPLSL